ncbi:MAG: F0F1 ATP synthase subunit gamma [Lachnospiraceae bacterium]|nr:F0F1 ATP synthase subunit gamma [Lachnospiraceae bacterium]
MRVKPIVKVMNFHSLIRVDKARKKAEKYLLLEKEASAIIEMIANNRNFFLDKTLWKTDEKKPKLYIFLGSDFGFCGSVNFTINQLIEEKPDVEKIVIGRKLKSNAKNVLLKLSRESLANEYYKIKELIDDSIRNKKNSEIYLVYNHFYNTTKIEPLVKKIFPFTIDTNAKKYTEDFYVEGDANKILTDLMITYVDYEIKIAEINSFASENIYRQNSTSESLKKIEEMEEEEKQMQRKNKTAKEFEKLLDNYSKTEGRKKK